MRNIWVNQEMRKSTAVLGVMVCVFLFLQTVLLICNTERQKQVYIEVIGGIYARAVEEEPMLESELAGIISGKATAAGQQAAERAFAQYGITGDLRVSLFPNVSFEYNIIVVSVLFGAGLIVMNLIQYRRFFGRIRRLTVYAQNILKDDYRTLIEENAEGDLGRLADAFVKIRDSINRSLLQTRDEKQYLVDLLQNISHQFKTKLTTLNLYNDILLNRSLTEEQRVSFLQENERQIQSMNTMTQSILKLARLDAQTITFAKEESPLNLTLEESVNSLRGLAADTGVKLQYCGNEIILAHDKMWMQEGFENIIKNCIEHTPAGGRVEVELYDTPIAVKVVISDTGEGLDQREAVRIFERFYKSGSGSRKDSVGIGLSISRSIIESHNGYIDVKSKKGVGTTFTISFLK